MRRAALLVLVFVGGCSDDTASLADRGPADRGPAGAEAGGLKPCTAICDKALQCQPTRDRALCVSDCERARVLDQAAMNQAMAACADLSCAEGATCTVAAQSKCNALPTASSVADSFCAKRKSCDSTTDLATCRAQFAPSLSCLAQAGLDKMAGCIAKATCDKLDQSIATCMRS